MADLVGEVFKNAKRGDIVEHKNHKYVVLVVNSHTQDFIIKHVSGVSKGKKPYFSYYEDKKNKGTMDLKFDRYYYSNKKIREKLDRGRFYGVLVLSDLGRGYYITFPYELKSTKGDLWTTFTEAYWEEVQRNYRSQYNDKALIAGLKAIEDIIVFKPLKPQSEKVNYSLMQMVDMVAKNDWNKAEKIADIMKDPKAAETIRMNIKHRRGAFYDQIHRGHEDTYGT